jgi:hypothetical protein
VDYRRADGLRVALMSFNYFDMPGSGVTPRTTRPKPALSLEQLATIAVSTKWSTTVPSALEAQAKADLKGFTNLGN